MITSKEELLKIVKEIKDNLGKRLIEMDKVMMDQQDIIKKFHQLDNESKTDMDKFMAAIKDVTPDLMSDDLLDTMLQLQNLKRKELEQAKEMNTKTAKLLGGII